MTNMGGQRRHIVSKWGIFFMQTKPPPPRWVTIFFITSIIIFRICCIAYSTLFLTVPFITFIVHTFFCCFAHSSLFLTMHFITFIVNRIRRITCWSLFLLTMHFFQQHPITPCPETGFKVEKHCAGKLVHGDTQYGCLSQMFNTHPLQYWFNRSSFCKTWTCYVDLFRLF